MVELFERDERTQMRQSSKGNQLKWENNGVWYKADYTGYEGLSEYLISNLLCRSTLRDAEFVRYEPEQIRYRKKIYQGVKSNNFLHGDWQLVTLERLFKQMYNKSLTETIWKIGEISARLEYLVEQVERITGLHEFGKYRNKLLTMDAFFLNEDRHMHNIAVLMNGEGMFDYCPIFDNGAGLLADTSLDYPLDVEVYSLIKEVRAKTVSSDFDTALDASEQLYGKQLKFFFHKKDVERLLKSVEGYGSDICSRVQTILFYQMDKYAYLFEN